MEMYSQICITQQNFINQWQQSHTIKVSKHVCLLPFFPKDSVYLVFA